MYGKWPARLLMKKWKTISCWDWKNNIAITPNKNSQLPGDAKPREDCVVSVGHGCYSYFEVKNKGR